MRSIKTLLAGFALLTLATFANADVVVRIAGSTAFRANAHTAITHIFDSGSLTYGWIGTSGLGKAGKAIFKGTIAGITGNVTIKTSWTGAVGGQVSVMNSDITQKYLEDGGTTLSAALTSGGTANLTDNSVASGAGNPVDVCMMDHFQATTPYTSPALTTTQVGVVQFKWLINNPGTGVAAPFTNITPRLAQALYANGSLSLASFTGNPADEGKLVWAIGRDADSGTRVGQTQESGIGYDSQVVQWTPAINGSNQVTSHVLAVNAAAVPAAVQANHPNAGDGGYNSGGTLTTVLTATTPNALDDGNGGTKSGYYVGYASIGDATTTISGGGKELTWNGVPYSQTAVQEGLYTFWGYESVGYLATLTGDKKTVADKLANQILTADAPPPLLSQMHCSRTTDGANVTPNY